MFRIGSDSLMIQAAFEMQLSVAEANAAQLVAIYIFIYMYKVDFVWGICVPATNCTRKARSS